MAINKEKARLKTSANKQRKKKAKKPVAINKEKGRLKTSGNKQRKRKAKKPVAINKEKGRLKTSGNKQINKENKTGMSHCIRLEPNDLKISASISMTPEKQGDQLFSVCGITTAVSKVKKFFSDF